MSEQSEERLFIGITPNGIETCREPDIIDNPEAYNDALQKIQDTGHPVFIPGSPFVSIEARCCVNTMPEIQLDK